MIKDYQKLKLPDESKLHDVIFEVNWNPHDKAVTDCKLVRITHPGGKSSIIKKEHLNAFLFAIGNEAEQRKMIPQVINRSRHYKTVVTVKAKENIKKGEDVTFPIDISLPTFQEEIIAEAKQDLTKNLTRADN